MNITFLIGNGFDRNLGLKTLYSDFTKYYEGLDHESEVLKRFRKDIHENKELWSAAEIAMGKYTSAFNSGEAAFYSQCHTDFCKHLSLYLKGQEKRIDYESAESIIVESFSSINHITRSFPTQERNILGTIYSNHRAEAINFNFICFNYTNTLDTCISLVKKVPTILGTHKNGSQTLNHSIGQLCHVHGTVDKQMVFGVNDDTQIAKPEIFECENGDLYKSSIIKVQTNASYLENTDATAAQMIQNSHLIYIYGMSIGDTDKLWWDRICSWLAGNVDRHLIIHKYHMPPKDVVQIDYFIAEREAKKELTRHSNLNDNQKNNIEQRIHITNENIFSKMSGIAGDKPDSTDNKILTYAEYLDIISETEKNTIKV